MNMFSTTYIVVDALDELQDDTRFELVETLCSFHKALFMTSRPLDLSNGMEPDFCIRAPSEDFKNFINLEISRLPKLNSLLKKKGDVLNDVVDRIKTKSDGMSVCNS